MMHLRIHSFERCVLNKSVSQVTLPSLTGDFVVNDGHTEIISALSGFVRMKGKNGETLEPFHLERGMAYVKGSLIRIFTLFNDFNAFPIKSFAPEQQEQVEAASSSNEHTNTTPSV